jgi:putative ABC transport system permease protein
MRTFLANVQFTLRLIRRSPGFYALILALLTAGIGATTAMFSVAESVLLKPLPYSQAEDLTDVYRVDPEFPRAPASLADFIDWRAQGTSFEQMTAVTSHFFSLSFDGSVPVSVPGAGVSADFFPMLRVAPLLGRLLGPDDDRPDAPLAAVISAHLWESRFASDPKILGRAILLSSRPYTVVGVAPRGFAFGSRSNGHVDIWTSLSGPRTAETYAKEVSNERGSHYLTVMGRRRHGVSLAEAQAQMTGIAKSLEASFPNSNTKQAIYLQDLHESLVGKQGRQVWILFAAVALVFLVISANVASLLLARAQARRGELATRAALGAAPSALVVQVITETTVLFAIGALLGGALAASLVGELASYLLDGRAVGASVSVRLDAVVLALSIVTSLVFGIAAGCGPALVTARTDPGSVLKETSARAGGHRSQATVRALLVVTQLAVAFALLTGSGLTLRAFTRLLRTEPGFDKTGLATAHITLPARKYDTDDKLRTFYRSAISAIGSLPGVESVAANSFLPMSESDSNGDFSIEGRPLWAPGEQPALDRNFVTPGYFTTMRIPLLRGREFTSEDTATSRPVIIISKATAERFFPGEDALGRRLGWGAPSEAGFAWREIVGIVGDVRKQGLDAVPVAEGYTPFEQDAFAAMYFVVRTKAPETVLAAVPHVIQTLDPEQAVSRLVTMEDRVADTIGRAHQMAVLLSSFAAVALILATLGLFGLVSYATAARTRELGIRLALGSSPEALVALVVKGAMKLVLLGLLIGAALSGWVGHEIAEIMPGSGGAGGGGIAFEPAVIAPIPFILGLAGLVACLLPALRAVRTPPASALRYE